MTVRGQPHEFILAAVDFKPAITGEGGIKQSDRMGKIKFPKNFDGPALPQTDGGCRPLADAIDRQNGCLIKR
jgi:hypothetical protein